MQQGSINISIISDSEKFYLLHEEWNELLKNSDSDTIFLRWEWFYNWWQVYRKEGCRLFLIVVRDDGCLVGIAPLYKKKIISFLPFTSLELCSSSDLQPDYLDIIVKNGKEVEVIKALFDYLIRHEKHCLAAKFDYLLSDAILLKSKEYFENSFFFDIALSSICPYLEINGSFDDYFQKHFKRKKRYNLKRELNILLNKKEVVFYKVESDEKIEEEILRFYELHNIRAKQKRISSSIANTNFIEFIKEYSKMAFNEGRLSLYFLIHKSRQISTIYCLTYKKNVFFYQSGFDPSWKKYGVGTSLLQMVIHDAFDKGFKKFDFLKGNESYKKAWATGQRQQYRLMVYRKSVFGMLIYLLKFIINFLSK